ncbi:hypothetical protein GEMRC1_007231 [Eukaryota sp. GEM-RC1]
MISAKLNTIIADYGLQTKTQSWTTDNAGNIVNAVDLLNERSENQRCFAHVLNIMVQNGLPFIQASILKIQKLTSKTHMSSSLNEKLKTCAKDTGKKFQRIPSDVPTRWNSTCLMLKTYHDQLAIINYFLQNEQITELILSDFETVTLSKLLKLLKPFYDITTDLSSASDVTISHTILYWETIKEVLDVEIAKFGQGVLNSNLAELENIRRKSDLHKKMQELSEVYPNKVTGFCSIFMKKIIAKYDANVLNDTTKIATVMDPSIKLSPLMWPTHVNLQEVRHLLLTRLQEEYSSENGEREVRKKTKSFRAKLKIIKESVSQNSTTDESSEYEDLSVEKELDTYLSMFLAENDNTLDWWRVNSENFPLMSKFARDMLAVQATSVSSERLFSQTGNVITKKRSRLDDTTVTALMCLRCWLLNEEDQKDDE